MEVLNLLAGVIVIGLVCLIAGIKLGRKFQHYDNLKTANGELKEQLAKRRHTYSTADGLEDALAVTVDLILRGNLERKYWRAQVDQLNEILGMVRAGPLAYDVDRSSKRPPSKDEA